MTEFEIHPLTNKNHAIAIVTHSGVHIGATSMVRNFCWECHEYLDSSTKGYFDKERIQWLVDWSIAELYKYKKAGNKLPGSSIHGDDDAVEVLAGALDKLADNNTSLTGNNTILTKSNTTLTDTNAKQADHIVELSGLLRKKEDEFEAYKVANPPMVVAPAQPQPRRQPLREVVAQPAPVTTGPGPVIPGPGPSRTRSTRSTKKSQRKKVADDWEDDEEVQVAVDYHIKKYAGKTGVVSLTSSTESMVYVIFDDPKIPDKLIRPEGLKSLCH